MLCSLQNATTSGLIMKGCKSICAIWVWSISVKWARNKSCTYLVYSWQRSLGSNNFLQMANSERANPNAFQFTLLLCITDSFPAFLPSLRSTDGSMYEIQVNVTKPAFVQWFLYGFLDIAVAVIQLKLSSEEDFGARNVGPFAKIKNGSSAFTLIFVPFRWILSSVIVNWFRNKWQLQADTAYDETVPCLDKRSGKHSISLRLLHTSNAHRTPL